MTFTKILFPNKVRYHRLGLECMFLRETIQSTTVGNLALSVLVGLGHWGAWAGDERDRRK